MTPSVFSSNSSDVIETFTLMAILNDFSGFEFEDLMEDVYRRLGYENGNQAVKTADKRRDLFMEEVVDGGNVIPQF